MSFPYITRSAIVGTSSTNAYATGNVIGTGLNVLQNLPRDMFIQGVTIVSKSSQQSAQIDFIPFRSSMPNTTFTNLSAIAISTLDSSSTMSPIHISDWTSLGTPNVGTANGLAYAYRGSNSDVPNSLYFALVTRGTPTFNSSSDLMVSVTFVS